MKLLLPILLSVLLLTPPVLAQPEDSDAQITHVLNRLTFGARPGDIEKVRSMGIKRFIDTQLNPSTLAESPVVIDQLQRTTSLRAPSSQLLAEFQAFQREKKAQKSALTATGSGSKNDNLLARNNSGQAGSDSMEQMEQGMSSDNQQSNDNQEPAEQGFGKRGKRAGKNRGLINPRQTEQNMSDSQQLNDNQEPADQEFGKRGKKAGKGSGKGPGNNGGLMNPRQGIAAEVIETRLVREIESPRQLNELMTDFWFNHFNVSMAKGVDHVLVGAYEEQAIRPYVMGNFRDLLGATMHHPAMMFYLDNAQNTKADFQTANPKNKKRGINENYARELLELHTLGVDGGYTQQDVTELARVLTGWGMPNQRAAYAAGIARYWSTFEAQRHDMGDKVILGQTIKGTGPQEIEQVLDMLAKNPATAKHISFQLAQYFVDDKPPQSLVDKLSARYMQSGGDIKAMLKTLFASQEFWDTKYENSKFKSPLHYTISAMRATGAKVDQPKQIVNFLRLQGQPLYECLTPDGYKNTKEAWLNSDGLLKRMDWAVRLDSQQRRLDSPVDYQAVSSTVNGGKLSQKTQQAIAKAPEYEKVAALIGSPEFMRY